MLKLNIQMFGGRGASSGSNKPRGEKLNIVAGNESKRISFNSLKKGDTFTVSGGGNTYNAKITSKVEGGYNIEGRHNESGRTVISRLVTDKTHSNADSVSKLYMTPLSRTGNWRRS